MADRPLGPGDRVRIDAPDLGYHGWCGVITGGELKKLASNSDLIGVRFQRPDRGPEGADVGFFFLYELRVDAVDALGRLADGT